LQKRIIILTLKINSEIFDIFGNKRLEADISYEVTTLQENKSFVIGKILFNLKNLEKDYSLLLFVMNLIALLSN
jgi:hypothetical protein